MYILSAFIIHLSNSIGTTKKPFNSVLGETYEFIDPKYNTYFIAE